MKNTRVTAALTLVVAVLALQSPLRLDLPLASPPPAEAADLEAGDYLVGVGVDYSFGSLRGKVVRVRGGQATDFCTPQAQQGSFFNDGAYEAGFFNVPREVVIDAQGRVVFLAYLGGTFDSAFQGGWGLWRCDSMGATPTLLGAFGAEHPNYQNYPKPLGARDIRQAHGLHLKIRKGVDLNSLGMTTQQFYVFGVSEDCCSGSSPHDTVAYNAGTGEWVVDNLVPPVPTAGYYLDMINANGYTFSVSQNGVRAFFEPVSLDFQVGQFTGGVAFQSLNDLIGGTINSTALVDVDPGNCPPPLDGITNAAPLNEGGGFNVMAGFYGAAWYNGGLVLTSDSIAAHDAFLPNFSLALLDYDPTNDRSDMFHQPYAGCVVVKAPKYTPWHNSFWDSKGTPRNVRQMTPDGTAGTQADRIVTLSAAEVTTLAEGLVAPTGIDVFPGFMPPLTGLAVFFQINSPVDVLITGPDGRRIGVDPGTGQPVNDYGPAGYDSSTNEPHIYGIWDPPPGEYSISTRGTGTGLYTISAFGADLGANGITRASFTGNATPGSASAHRLGLSASGSVTRDDPAGPTIDLAVTDINAPAQVVMRPGGAVTRSVRVRIQNRSAQPVTIPDAATLAGLTTLSFENLGGGTCPAPSATVQPAFLRRLPITLRPKQKVLVPFDVTFGCANDPADGTSRNPGHDDFSVSARVDAAALGGADLHGEDDVCPRSVDPPGAADPHPDGTIVDRGCGKRKPDGTFGAPVVVDIVVRP